MFALALCLYLALDVGEIFRSGLRKWSREEARGAHLTNKQGYRVFREEAHTVVGVERSKGNACQSHGKMTGVWEGWPEAWPWPAQQL